MNEENCQKDSEKSCHKQKSKIASAFRAVYFMAFVWTIYQLSAAVFYASNSQAFKIVSGTYNVLVLYWLFGAIVLVSGAHLIRLYVTLEMLEEGHKMFEGMFENFPPFAKFIELVLRCLIVVAVTLKTTTSDGLTSPNLLSLMLLLAHVYGALTLWSIFYLIAQKYYTGKLEFKKTYLGAALTGLIAVCIQVFIFKHSSPEISVPTTLFGTIFIGLLSLSLFVDWRDNKVHYKDWAIRKLYYFFPAS